MTGRLQQSPMPTLADVIREARKNKKWTQEKLADEIGVNPGYIGQIEAGIVKLPSADRLELLEQKLGISRADMLRAAGLLGPEEGIDLLAEFRRIAHLSSDAAKKTGTSSASRGSENST